MNLLQQRLANTNSVLVNQRAGTNRGNSYAIGEHLTTTGDVDLQVEESIVSVPAGTQAIVRENNSQQVLLDLGENLGQFVLEIGEVGKYFSRSKAESMIRDIRVKISESNPLVATPGAYVEVTGYDPKIGPNRGPKSPGFGGYQTLVGQKGQIATIYNLNVPGIMTYKVQLENGGEFVLGNTEFKVIRGAGTQESVDPNIIASKEPDIQALRSLGYGL